MIIYGAKETVSESANHCISFNRALSQKSFYPGLFTN